MGRFFNEKLMNLKKIPTATPGIKAPLEQMRKEFNNPVTLKAKRQANAAKAREALKRKHELNPG